MWEDRLLRSTVSWSTVPMPCPDWHTAGPTGRDCCASISGAPHLVKLLRRHWHPRKVLGLLSLPVLLQAGSCGATVVGLGTGRTLLLRLLSGISFRDRPVPCPPEGIHECPRSNPLRREQPLHVSHSWAGCSESLPRQSVCLPSLPGSCPPGQVLGYGIQMLEEDEEFT